MLQTQLLHALCFNRSSAMPLYATTRGGQGVRNVFQFQSQARCLFMQPYPHATIYSQYKVSIAQARCLFMQLIFTAPRQFSRVLFQSLKRDASLCNPETLMTPACTFELFQSLKRDASLCNPRPILSMP